MKDVQRIRQLAAEILELLDGSSSPMTKEEKVNKYQLQMKKGSGNSPKS